MQVEFALRCCDFNRPTRLGNSPVLPVDTSPRACYIRCMAVPSYQTFDLLIEASANGYRTRVLNSPAGQASTQFTLPFTASELDSFLARVGRRAPIAGTALKPEDLVKQFGGRLFDAVFTGEVLTSYRRSLDAAARAKQGLRVRLRLNDVPALADLPWEYLYDASRQDFLALSKHTPIVRYIEMPEPVAPLGAPTPLNLLAVLASPSDYDTLDVEGEWTRMKDALNGLVSQGKVMLTRVEPPTLDALLDCLRKNDYHVLHFIGHGEFSKTSQQGALIFQDDSGKGNAVSDERVATLLQDANTLRVVLLNACEGARTSASNPFAGVAPRLVQQGIPAVVAMQFPISDPAAVRFSTEFYRTLADRYPVDAAINEARRAIYFSGDVLEWGTPVLFMRAEDGMVFGKEEEMSEEAAGRRQEAESTRHGGITISGTAQVSAGRDFVSGDRNVQGDEYDVEGDINTVTIGAGATVGQVAAGHHITQTQGGGSQTDTADLAQKLMEVRRALHDAQAQLDASKIALADFQLQLLETELTKTGSAPSGATIMTAADGLLANAPMLNALLGALFHTTAAQRILQQTGASDWAKKRFG